MLVESEGIVLRQVKILKGRSMVVLFTEGMGKLSCGTNIGQGRKGNNPLGVRPFTRGNYSIASVNMRDKSYYNIKSCEVIDSYYSFGEDYDRFSGASIALEITDKLLIEEAPVPEVYGLLSTFLDMMETRTKSHLTLTVAYTLKLLQNLGVFPDKENFNDDSLLLNADSDIINRLIFILENPLARLGNLAIDSSSEKRMLRLMLGFAERNLDIGSLKSDL